MKSPTRNTTFQTQPATQSKNTQKQSSSSARSSIADVDKKSRPKSARPTRSSDFPSGGVSDFGGSEYDDQGSVSSFDTQKEEVVLQAMDEKVLLF